MIVLGEHMNSLEIIRTDGSFTLFHICISIKRIIKWGCSFCKCFCHVQQFWLQLLLTFLPFFFILTVGSSCFIAYWNQHQSTSDCTCGQYRIWSSCHCYCIHIYTGFCKLLLDHLISFIFSMYVHFFLWVPSTKKRRIISCIYLQLWIAGNCSFTGFCLQWICLEEPIWH